MLITGLSLHSSSSSTIHSHHCHQIKMEFKFILLGLDDKNTKIVGTPKIHILISQVTEQITPENLGKS